MQFDIIARFTRASCKKSRIIFIVDAKASELERGNRVGQLEPKVIASLIGSCGTVYGV